jgi:hypothetical protein
MGKKSTGQYEQHENKGSERGSDNRMGRQAGKGKVSGIEKVGGESGVRFGLPDHPDLSDVMRTPETK